nr:MAG TPA: hypothetical protein [Bacteriophage sp.]
MRPVYILLVLTLVIPRIDCLCPTNGIRCFPMLALSIPY